MPDSLLGVMRVNLNVIEILHILLLNLVDVWLDGFFLLEVLDWIVMCACPKAMFTLYEKVLERILPILNLLPNFYTKSYPFLC